MWDLDGLISFTFPFLDQKTKFGREKAPDTDAAGKGADRYRGAPTSFEGRSSARGPRALSVYALRMRDRRK